MPNVPTILVLNGPNLNLLGDRDPDIYGTETLANIEERCRSRAAELDLAVDFRQSNSEGELVDWIQDARASSAALIINPAAYTHSSIAIMDALSVLTIPVIELHLSNIHRRESFRRRSYVSKVATGVICGFGSSGYEMAVDSAAKLIGTGGKR